MPPPPAASAPAFEDLMSQTTHQEPYAMDMPSALMPLPPPPPEIDEDILAALDPSERQAILEEQRKIMEDIQRSKQGESASSSAAARADAFNQRSGAAVARVAGQYDSGPVMPSRSTTQQRKPPPPPPAAARPGMVDLGAGEMVPLHGQEKTQAAIRDGTARIVQCLNCENWMQVTNDATLMFCPTCQVVSPVLLDETATEKDLEEAAQMAADAQLAEKLQAEEYGAMERARATRPAAAAAAKKTPKLEKGQAVEQSWYDWFMGSSSQDGTKAAAPLPERGSAELPSRSPRAGLVAASTGEEPYGHESDRFTMGGTGGGGGARMAESKGMFACVADAVGTAVFAMNQDEEGNVHGVDSSGLLAMPNVSRQTN
jgi:Ubiquitin binding region